MLLTMRCLPHQLRCRNRWSIHRLGTIFFQCFCVILVVEIVIFSGQFHEYSNKPDEIELTETSDVMGTGANNFYKAQLRQARIEQKAKPVFKGISYKAEFSYPLDIDMGKLLSDIKKKKHVNVTVINPHPYHFTSLPQNKCNFQNNANWTITILMKSDIRNKERRKTIRNTWGNLTNHTNVEMVFMLGMPKNDTDGDISEEVKLNQDIIQENFIDAYRNNTIKTIMGFNWAVHYCKRADYLFFVDDDYFVNVDNMLKLPNRFRTKADVYGGTITSRAIPFRDNGSKWYISWEDYPFDRWPPYIMGGAYIVSMPTATQFQLVFPYIKPIFMDDAYLGIVARKLHIAPLGLPHFYSGNKKKKSMIGGMVASHGYSDPLDVIFTWKQLHSKHVIKSAIKPK